MREIDIDLSKDNIDHFTERYLKLMTDRPALLSDRDRRIIVLRFIEKKAFKDIGALLGINGNYVSVATRIAIGKLQRESIYLTSDADSARSYDATKRVNQKMIDDIRQATITLNAAKAIVDKALDDLHVCLSDPEGKIRVLTIEELGLSVRTNNCLKRAGYVTVDDVLKASHDDLMKCRNLGKRSYNELKDKLSMLGLDTTKM